MTFGIKNLILFGSGESLNYVAPRLHISDNTKILALQRVFPYCHKIFNIIPDYWSWFDANGSLDGLEYILKNSQSINFTKMNILVPKFACETYKHYRKFVGTTPINPDQWEKKYKDMLNKVAEIVQVKKIDATTTKRIALEPYDVRNKDFTKYDVHGLESHVRFANNNVLFGTVAYDSESGPSKWGTESKLSSTMLPLAHYLKAKQIYVCGVDFKGGRFYDKSKSRHAWGQNISESNTAVNYALSLIAKWEKWKNVHGMTICSLAPKEMSLLSNVLPVVKIEEIA